MVVFDWVIFGPPIVVGIASLEAALAAFFASPTIMMLSLSLGGLTAALAALFK